MRQRRILWVVGALVALVASACAGGVSQEAHSAVQAQLQAKQSELQTTADQLRAKQGEFQTTADQLRAKENELASLRKAIPTPEPPFKIAAETFDAKGSAAYEVKPGALLAFVQSGMAYDSPADANYVTVVDVKSRKVLAQVAVEMPKGYQSHGLGVSDNARWVYVPSLSSASKKLHIYDGRTLKLAKTLDVGANTHHVDEGTYKQTGKFVMVDTGNPEHGAILLDPNRDNVVIGHIPFGTVLGRPYSAWSSPDGSFAYVSVSSHLADEKGWLSKVDLSTFKETAFFPVGVGPVWVAFAADGRTAWVGNAKSNNVMQIKIGQSKDEKDAVVATIPLSFAPYGLVLAQDGKKLYAVGKTYTANDASTSVYVVDPEAKKVAREIKVGKQPDHVFLSPDGREVWVSENRGNRVSIVDTATDEVIGTIPMPGDTHSVRFVQFSNQPDAMAATTRAATAAGATASGGAADLVAQGEKIFQQTAGCQSCHGKDAKGLIGPNIRGKTADDIRFQLATNPQMQSLKLSDGEIEAAAAYLQSLAKQPN